VRALDIELIDYAGLFPPAQLPLPAAVHNDQHFHARPILFVLKGGQSYGMMHGFLNLLMAAADVRGYG
jgi:hypothetical protein